MLKAMNMNTPEQIEAYIRANGKRVNVIEECGDAENGPDATNYEFIRLGNLSLFDGDNGEVAITATNRRVTRSRTPFVQNEPYAAGAQVIIKDTFPQFVF